jgi:phosphatidylserine/phosphatidylglycerophosphate/cardiolipin synthase-like enzyme
MYKTALIFCFILSYCFCEQTLLSLGNTSIKVAFSPDDGITEMINGELQKAIKTIDVAAFSFTSIPIALKLIEASQRGVYVRVVLDKSQRKARGSVASLLLQNGISVRFNEIYKIQHNKYMIIDEKHVECGSFNFTKSAEKNNAENAIVVLDSPNFANTYTKNFNKLWNESSLLKKIESGKKRGYVKTVG